MKPKQNFINYSNFWYLKICFWLVCINALLYSIYQPSGTDPYGGTAMGYVLGVESALIVFYLGWFGMKKRLPAKRIVNCARAPEVGSKDALSKSVNIVHTERSAVFGSDQGMQGRLSVHVYLGLALLFLVTLHTGFELGPNVHTLAFVLMVLVMISGIFGVIIYLNYPSKMTQNMGGATLIETMQQISKLDDSGKFLALELPDEVKHLIAQSRMHTQIGVTPTQRLFGDYPDCPTQSAVMKLRLLAETYREGNQPQLMRELYSLLLNKHVLVNKARLDIMLKERLKYWLYLHIPLTAALILTLLIHIFAVFFYW